MKLAGDVIPLSYLYAYSALTAFGSLSAWGLINILLEKIVPRLAIEKEIVEYQSPKFIKVIYTSLLVIIAASSQFSMAYMAYYYNKLGVVWPIVVLLADSGLPMYSLHQMFKAFSKKSRCMAMCT